MLMDLGAIVKSINMLGKVGDPDITVIVRRECECGTGSSQSNGHQGAVAKLIESLSRPDPDRSLAIFNDGMHVVGAQAILDGKALKGITELIDRLELQSRRMGRAPQSISESRDPEAAIAIKTYCA